MTVEEVLALETRDYQHRNGSYPKSNIADSVEIRQRNDNEFVILCAFKNTTESHAKDWIENFATKHDLKFTSRAEAWQDGDYQDDWVMAELIVTI